VGAQTGGPLTPLPLGANEGSEKHGGTEMGCEDSGIHLHTVPDNVTNEQAVFVEPLAAACEILEQVRMTMGEPVAVLGDGKLGLLIAQVLHACGAKVKHFGRHPSKLRISREAGIKTTIVRELPSQAYDWVLDATGSPEAMQQAVRMTRPRGTLILKSTVHGLVPIDTAPVIVNELTLIGSRCGRFALALLSPRKGKVRVDATISLAIDQLLSTISEQHLGTSPQAPVSAPQILGCLAGVPCYPPMGSKPEVFAMIAPLGVDRAAVSHDRNPSVSFE
jgi:hypothetical protein